MDPCPNCSSNQNLEEECLVSIGVCDHPFHHHCIEQWLNTNETCPLDARQWCYASIGDKEMKQTNKAA